MLTNHIINKIINTKIIFLLPVVSNANKIKVAAAVVQIIILLVLSLAKEIRIIAPALNLNASEFGFCANPLTLLISPDNISGIVDKHKIIQDIRTAKATTLSIWKLSKVISTNSPPIKEDIKLNKVIIAILWLLDQNKEIVQKNIKNA